MSSVIFIADILYHIHGASDVAARRLPARAAVAGTATGDSGARSTCSIKPSGLVVATASARQRSPSPLAWRPDFPGAPREAH